MKIDLVSDLHVDVWGLDKSFDWLKYQQSDTLIVAGDTSDNQIVTCDYVVKLKQYYKNILIVDGNHEHAGRMSDITQSTLDWERMITETGAIYLAHTQPVFEGIKFIGVNGWWSFDFGLPNITGEQTEEACRARHGMNNLEIQNQKNRGLCDAAQLANWMVDANSDSNVDKIVVVTHTLPHASCISWNRYPPDINMVGCYGNRNYSWTLDADTNKKCRYWLFGHNHDCKNIPYQHINFTSNPRGRPEDWNRVSYTPLSLTI